MSFCLSGCLKLHLEQVCFERRELLVLLESGCSMPPPLLQGIVVEFSAHIESTGKGIALGSIGLEFVAIRL